MKKKTSIICMAALFLLMSVLTVAADATNYTSLYTSPASNGHVPTSGGTKYLSYSSNLNGVCGGDVGMWFYYGTTELNDSFARDPNRYVYVEAYELDGSAYDTFRIYEGYFSCTETNTVENWSTSWSYTMTSSASIETDGSLELCMYYTVSPCTGDSSVYVSTGLFRYRFWAY